MYSKPLQRTLVTRNAFQVTSTQTSLFKYFAPVTTPARQPVITTGRQPLATTTQTKTSTRSTDGDSSDTTNRANHVRKDIECFLHAWDDPVFRKYCSITAWAWLRIMQPTLLPWHHLTTATTPVFPGLNNDLQDDGSICGHCHFIYNTGYAEQFVVRKSISIKQDNVRLKCGHCTQPYGPIEANEVIALGCGLIQSKEQWTEMIERTLNVSHLCHNPICREPSHLAIEGYITNAKRVSCRGKPRCQCVGVADPCRPQLHMAPSKFATYHQGLRAQKELHKCVHQGCNWTNDCRYEDPFLIHSMTKSANGRPNHATAVPIAESLLQYLTWDHGFLDVTPVLPSKYQHTVSAADLL